jgi:hypothetical protein
MHNLSIMQFPNQNNMTRNDALRSAVVVLPVLVLVVVDTAP